MLDNAEDKDLWDDEWATWAALAGRRAEESRQWFAPPPPAEPHPAEPPAASA